MNGAPGMLAQEHVPRTMRSRSSTCRTHTFGCTHRCTTHCIVHSQCCADVEDTGAAPSPVRQLPPERREDDQPERLSATELYSLSRFGRRLSTAQQIAQVLAQHLEAAQLPRQRLGMKVRLQEAVAPPHAEKLAMLIQPYELLCSQ